MSTFRFAFESVLIDAVRKKVRNGSIRLLKRYVQLIRGVRAVGLGITALSAVVSLCVGGFLMMLIGLIGLLPIETQTKLIILASAGFVLFATCGTIIWLIFREKVWLERARVHELMDLALHNEWVEPKQAPTETTSRRQEYSSAISPLPAI